MRRLRIFIFFLIVIAQVSVIYPIRAEAAGIDRTRIRARISRGRGYTVTLAIGDMTFEGTLMRGDELTDDDIEKAITNVLERSNGLTEKQIGEWTQRIEKVARPREGSTTRNRQVRDYALNYIEADTPLNVIEYMVGVSDKSAQDLAMDWIVDEGFDQITELVAMRARLTSVQGFIAGLIVKSLQVVISEADYWLDKRVNEQMAAEMKKIVDIVYERINTELEREQGRREACWTLQINNKSESKDLYIAGIGGNSEDWRVNMTYRKWDFETSRAAAGRYSGTAAITATYDLSGFDSHFIDYLKQTDYSVITELPKVGFTAEATDTYQKTEIKRSMSNYSNKSAVIDLTFIPERPAGTISRKIEFSDLEEKKSISAYHSVTTISNQIQGTLRKNWVVTYRENFTIDASTIVSEAEVLSIFEDGVASETYETEGITVPTESDPAFQQIWSQWGKDMILYLYATAPSPYEPIQQFK